MANLPNRKKRQGRGKGGKDENDLAPTKEEQKVGKFLRWNMDTREGFIMNNNVEYFSGQKAVDFLMASHFASSTSKRDDSILFATRAACIDFCQTLLEKGMFHRVNRVRKQKKKTAPKLTSGQSDKEKSDKEKEMKKKKRATTEQSGAEASQEVSGTEKEKEQSSSESSKPKKQKKPSKLELCNENDQVFLDESDAYYFWIYDPTRPRTFLVGGLVIIAVIAGCLYPLWPIQLRLGVYYICLGLLGILGALAVLAVLRALLFASCWVLTFGKKSFWLFPNLFEDVGFRESFQPIYAFSVSDASSKKSSKSATGESADKKAKSEADGKVLNPLAEEKGEEESKPQTGDSQSKPVEASDVTRHSSTGSSADGGGPANLNGSRESSSGEGSSRDYELVQHSEFDEPMVPVTGSSDSKENE